jgi:hypothetical protein
VTDEARQVEHAESQAVVPPFERSFELGAGTLTVIGSGSIGGKAQGLATMRAVLDRDVGPRFADRVRVNIPTLVVIGTQHFDLFLRNNDLYETAFSDTRDDLLGHAFQRSDLPAQLVGDLRALIAKVHSPLAVRSSSMLEDAIYRPFAGVYGTKMIPNNEHDSNERFRKLVEAIKYVYASTFFGAAKRYMLATGNVPADEKMAVIIQEVVGSDYRDRFYPHISGVARSYNFYPTGHAKPEDGVVELALGLGRTIVDDGVAWTYSPAYPRANPPYNSIRDLLRNSQLRFWAVNMGKPPEYDPIKETEYLVSSELGAAEWDGTLRHIASTYRGQDDRIVMGTAERGPRLIDFAPILKGGYVPLNDLVRLLLQVCVDVVENEVEIEFAVTLDGEAGELARFGLLQVRPMVVASDETEVTAEDLHGDKVLAASESVLGNGALDTIRDVVYVRTGRFPASDAQGISVQLERMNNALCAENRPYLLLGFGRWGTSDPSAGIPVDFGQISGAKVIVEATLPDINYPLSQGSHFFQNVTSFKILYFSVPYEGEYGIDWSWLDSRSALAETDFVRHVRLDEPLEIRVDGRRGCGVIRHA